MKRVKYLQSCTLIHLPCGRRRTIPQCYILYYLYASLVQIRTISMPFTHSIARSLSLCTFEHIILHSRIYLLVGIVTISCLPAWPSIRCWLCEYKWYNVYTHHTTLHTPNGCFMFYRFSERSINSLRFNGMTWDNDLVVVLYNDKDARCRWWWWRWRWAYNFSTFFFCFLPRQRSFPRFEKSGWIVSLSLSGLVANYMFSLHLGFTKKMFCRPVTVK